MPPSFLFAVCQPGAEAALKQEVARRQPELRFAFSRPGFVTFRVPAEGPSGDDGVELRSTFARTWGFSLGKVRGADDERLAQEAWRMLGEHYPPNGLAQFAHLHVWPRERTLPGDVGFDPDVPPPAAGARLLAARPARGGAAWVPSLNQCAAPGELVLDCVLVEPQEWWLGWHRAGSPETRWPGGVPELTAPADMISRAYLKLE
jgi:23S rRNA (cytidine2498-2'-O)-methyltransferase